MYNEMDGNFDYVAISTFKSGLPTKHDSRKSLTGKPVTSVRQLMDWIDKYKRVEEDQLRLSTGWVGSGFGLTHIRPDWIRWTKNRPATAWTFG